MTMTAKIDIERFRGDTAPIVIQLVDSASSPIGDAIGGATFLMTVSPEQWPTTGTPLFQVAGTSIDDTAKTVNFEISLANADNLGAFYYDVQMTDSAGVIRTILSGLMLFEQDITK